MRILEVRKAMKWKVWLLGALGGSLFLSGCGSTTPLEETANGSELTVEEIQVGNYSAGISCHDPQILRDKTGYYMTGSHQVIAKSEDLVSWDYVANGNKMFDNIFSGDLPAFSYVGKNEDNGYSIWASNFYYNKTMGKYLMYFCTTSSYIKSNLTLAVSDTPEGPYHYTDTFLYSGFGKTELDKTNLPEVLGEDADYDKYFLYGGYDNKKWPNCIDPAIVEDKEGNIWMVYGSWSGGIFLLQIDPETGLPIHPEKDGENVDRYYGYHLVGGKHHAIEGPYLSYDPESDYYYLFLSFGNLQREGGYQMREFRSKEITGPYVDAAGNTLDDQEDFFQYGLKMMGNYKLPSLKTAYMAPGGQSTLEDEKGHRFMSYHQRFDNGSEYHEPRVHEMFRTAEGWYVLAPFEYNGEAAEVLEQENLNGTWYFLNHETDISSVIREAKEVTLDAGAIGGNVEGTFAQTEDGTVTLRIGEEEYTGLCIRQKDEAGNQTRCILACGTNNKTIWLVQYVSE